MGGRGDSGYLAFRILGSFSRALNDIQIHLKTQLPSFFPQVFSSEIRPQKFMCVPQSQRVLGLAPLLLVPQHHCPWCCLGLVS